VVGTRPGTVGGILANSTRPVEFIYDDAMGAAGLILPADGHQVTRPLYLDSSCFYPRQAPPWDFLFVDGFADARVFLDLGRPGGPPRISLGERLATTYPWVRRHVATVPLGGGQA
jgi:hypothetical protein